MSDTKPLSGGHFILDPIGSHPILSRETFTEEHREIEEMVKQFAAERIRPHKAELEAYNKDLSLQLLRELGDLGLLGIDIKEEYGGLELDKVTSAIVAENLSHGFTASFTVTWSVQTGIGSLPIIWFGNEAQKQKYLPKIVTGEWVAAFGLTEPSAGSDATSGKTTARKSEDGTHYIVNGEKVFITNGGWADVYTVFCQVDGTKFSALIVDRDTPGFDIGAEEKKMGMKGSSTTPLKFTDARVPVENLLYEEGKGAKIAFNALDIGRLKLAASDLGGCKVVLEYAAQYAQDRRQFGQPIAHFDVIKGKIADMVVRTYAADSMIYRTIGLIQAEIDTLDKSAQDYYIKMGEAMEHFAIEASMTKVYGSESLGLVTDSAVQIMGGYGFIEDYPIAGAYRDTRIDRIWEGTNEINRQIIAGYMLKKALLDELPIREAIHAIEGFLQDTNWRQSEGILGREVQAIETGKRLALYLFHEALCEFGQDLKHEQQLTEILANMLIDIYTADSTLARVLQLPEDYPYRIQTLDIARVHAADSSLRLMNLALNGLNGIFHGSLPARVIDAMREFQKRMLLPTDILSLKRRIAETIYSLKSYPY
ncbi:MAG: acyl-CoA dehydrogenase [Candidatus Neomarinimicrobiota bacterium]|nr:MAG: acyl-CoA dehydrogenase [Candidatus Neomarinimicrobiota bacterium]